jgi:hypothetical protein
MTWLLLLITALLAGTSVAQDKPTPEKAKWETLAPTIKTVLVQQGSTCPGQPIRVGIKDAAELAGNSVALVNFCPGGAYTDWYVAMRLENGQPVPARFRDKNGNIADVGFAEGASVMHGMDVKLVADKSALYGIEWDNDAEMHLMRCAVTAYIWNPKENTFDLNPRLSKTAGASYCQTLQKELVKQH